MPILMDFVSRFVVLARVKVVGTENTQSLAMRL
jgi:hypothetical protein